MMMPVICDQVPSNRHQTVFIGLALYYKNEEESHARPSSSLGNVNVLM